MRKIVLFALLTALCASCSRNQSFMTPENTIVELPKDRLNLTYTSSGEIMGLWSARSVDSLLLLRVEWHDNSLIVANSSTMQIYDTILHQGRGPGEYNNLALQGQYYKKDGDIVIWTRDNDLKLIRSINLTQTLQQEQPVVVDEYRFSGKFYNIYNIGGKDLAGDFYDENKEQFYFSRYDAQSGKFNHYFPFFTRFTRDISIGSCNATLKPDASRMAFAMIFLNQILFTSTDGKNAFTVSVGTPIKEDAVFGIPMDKRREYFKPLTSNDKQVWVLSNNHDDPKSDLLLVFDWDGNLLYSFELGTRLRTIFFDALDNKKLYGIDYNENIVSFDVGEYVE